MGQIKYNKLVRDRIPEIIEASGKSCVTKILSDEDYLCMIDAKLDEELAEYHKDQNIEELADLIEVIYAAAKARGYTLEQLETVRAEKSAKRGVFQKKLLLKKVIDPNPNSKILEKIRQNQSAIMEKLNPKVLATYCWLQDNLHKQNVAVDTEYRKKFSGYYRMRFVSQEYRDQFFKLFEEIKSESFPSFRAVSQKLFQVDGKHEFSFITKMLHTIEPSRPIYDSQVDIALEIHRYYQPNFEEKLRQDEHILAQISAAYRELASSPGMIELLAEFDKIIPGHTMSAEKKIDFILWALGGICRNHSTVCSS